MSFATLALISLVAIAGPLLALPRRRHLPVMLGELAAGIVLGPTGSGRLRAHNETFTFLADIGFALIMFVVGSQVPVREGSLRTALRIGVLRAAGVGFLSVPLALVVAKTFGTGHAALYAVLMASSSAALILPIVDSLRLSGTPVLQMLPQVAVADTACIVALPLAIDPGHAGRSALGALAVLACAAGVFVVLRYLARRDSAAGAPGLPGPRVRPRVADQPGGAVRAGGHRHPRACVDHAGRVLLRTRGRGRR
jgi:Kef-type K+ transport system membrane component KefB